MTAQADLRKFTKSLRARLAQVTSKKALTEIGTFMISMIVTRTRRGKGVKKTGGAESPLAPLRPSTIAFRTRNANRLSPLTTAKKSNLTFTGQLLDSVRVKKVRRTEASAFVSIGPNRRRRKGGITNEDLGVAMEKGDRSRNRKPRPFMNLSKRELEMLDNFIETRVANVFKGF